MACMGQTSRPNIIGIVATASNRVIGNDGEVPWHVPTDLRHFMQTTMGSTVVVGRETWEKMPPLGGRTVIVLSSTMKPGGVRVAKTVEDAMNQCRSENLYVIGGAQTYDAFMGEYDEFIVSFVEAEPEGDVHFKDEWLSGFRGTNYEYPERGENDEFGFFVARYYVPDLSMKQVLSSVDDSEE